MLTNEWNNWSEPFERSWLIGLMKYHCFYDPDRWRFLWTLMCCRSGWPFYPRLGTYCFVPCLQISAFFYWWLCGFDSSVPGRASEQEHLNVTEPIHNGSSATQQLDLDLYLGVYAGEAQWAQLPLSATEAPHNPAIHWAHPRALAGAQGLQGLVSILCVYRASAAREDRSAFLVFKCWIALRSDVIVFPWLLTSSVSHWACVHSP